MLVTLINSIALILFKPFHNNIKLLLESSLVVNPKVHIFYFNKKHTKQREKSIDSTLGYPLDIWNIKQLTQT